MQDLFKYVELGEDDPWPAPTFDLPSLDIAQLVRSAARVDYEYQVWQKLETGAKCSSGESKTFTRGYCAPDGWEFVEIVRIEEFEGSAWLSYLREDKKYWEMTTKCSGNELAKFRMHVTMKRPITGTQKFF
jgi:hypothetical protein